MKSLEDLRAIRAKMQAQNGLRTTDENTTRVIVGMATCGIAAGARPVLNTLVEEVNNRQLNNVHVTQTGCIGMCRLEPIVEVLVPGQEKVTYVKMTAEKARRIVEEHLIGGDIVTPYTIGAAE